MRRRRSAQILVAFGLVVAVIGSLTAAAIVLTRATTVVGGAAPDLLAIPEVGEEVRGEFAAGIRDAYRPTQVSDEVLDVATERMLENGYIVDEFAAALEIAHRAWLDGGELAVELDPTEVTRAARTGLSDADPSFAAANPLPEVVVPAPVGLPWYGSAESSATALRVAGVLVLGGLVIFLAGAIAAPRADRPLKGLARAVVVVGGSMLLVGLVPFAWVDGLDHRVAAVVALVAPVRVTVLVVAAVLLICGLWLHGAADRIVAGVARTFGGARQHSQTDAPVPSGGRRVGRQSTRRRAAAIDAFFDGDASAGPDGDPAPVAIEAREDGEDPPVATDGNGTDVDDSDADVTDEDGQEGRPASSPEQERAEALATERREALERIDGTKSGYRTHLGR